jgi:hypothetical protein
MEEGEECCNDKILEDDEFCCTKGEADNSDEAQGDLIGEEEDICNEGDVVNDKCFVRRLCADGDGNEEHGEDGDASVTCNYEVLCATAIVHSCNKDRPNNNCQDECLIEDPPPEWCENGEGVVDGKCGDTGTCLAGIYAAIPG